MQGSLGLQGVQGSQGTQAAQGTNGTQGPIGYGNQGTTGFGLQGTIGSQGLNGTQGPQNFQGTTGQQGTAGQVQGATGTQGTQGTTGAGNQGPVGPGGLGSGSTSHLAYYSGSATVTSDSGSTTDGAGNLSVSSLYATGNVTAYSDARVKTNVVTIENALEKTMSLRGVTFNRIADGTVGTTNDKTFMGVIAQEVQKVIPEVVFKAKNGTDLLSVDYGNIVGLLIEAIKELKSEIDQLKN